MYQIYAMGEMLIDFTLNPKKLFVPNPGGAPANLCGAVKKLGGESALITTLSQDYFGNFLMDTLITYQVNTKYITRVQDKTMLAFVTLDSNNDRSFKFYDEHTADKKLSIKPLESTIFQKDYFHFCSVSLQNKQNINAHLKMIKKIKDHSGLVSFDPNLRLSLWKHKEKLLDTVWKFIELSDIVKVSEEELKFLTNLDEAKAIQSFFLKPIRILIITRGKDGATLITRQKRYDQHAKPVTVMDTTGAGDAFMGAFLYQVQQQKIDTSNLLTVDYSNILSFSTDIATKSVQHVGAIPSYIFDDVSSKK